MKKVLLDSSLLIAALDDQSDTAEADRQQAKERLSELLTDKNTALALSPLVRYEVLRGVAWIDQARYTKFLATLNGFEELQINSDIAEWATCLYRFDRHQSGQKGHEKNFEKRKFDIFHFATAMSYQLEIAGRDKDFDKISKLYDEMKKQLVRCR